jgi:hypothetical protein
MVGSHSCVKSNLGSKNLEQFAWISFLTLTSLIPSQGTSFSN